MDRGETRALHVWFDSDSPHCNSDPWYLACSARFLLVSMIDRLRKLGDDALLECVGALIGTLTALGIRTVSPAAVAEFIRTTVDKVPDEYMKPYQEVMDMHDDKTILDTWSSLWLDLDSWPGAVLVAMNAVSQVFPDAIRQDEDTKMLEPSMRVPPYEAAQIADLLDQQAAEQETGGGGGAV